MIIYRNSDNSVFALILGRRRKVSLLLVSRPVDPVPLRVVSREPVGVGVDSWVLVRLVGIHLVVVLLKLEKVGMLLCVQRPLMALLKAGLKFDLGLVLLLVRRPLLCGGLAVEIVAGLLCILRADP